MLKHMMEWKNKFLPLHKDVFPVPGGPCNKMTRFVEIILFDICFSAKIMAAIA